MLYFNSQKIPELAGLNFAQRMEIIRRAADNLPTPTKVALNILKLLILTPLFLLIARSSSGWEMAAYAIALVVLYPLITRPITFALCRKQYRLLRHQLFNDKH